MISGDASSEVHGTLEEVRPALIEPIEGVGAFLAAPQEQTVRWIGWLSVVALTFIAWAVLWQAPALQNLNGETRAIVVGIVSSIVTCLTGAVATVVGVKAALAPMSPPKAQ